MQNSGDRLLLALVVFAWVWAPCMPGILVDSSKGALIRRSEIRLDARMVDQEEILSLLKSRDSSIKDVLGSGDGPYSETQKEELKVLINDIMDFMEMSKVALSRYWESLDEAQKTGFVRDFSELVKRSSVKKLDIFHAVIEYKDVRMDGEKAFVHTVAIYKRTRTNVDYNLLKRNDKWYVIDFSIDGVSTADSYRRSFQRIMRKHGFPGLMERLKKKLKEEGM